MNTLANPHIAKLRAAPEPVSADDHHGDNLDRWDEDILAEEWQAEAWAKGHRPSLPPDWPPQSCASHSADHSHRNEQAKQRILQILRSGEWMSTRQVADARGVAAVTAVAKWLRALRDEGRTVAYWRLTRREAAE